MRRVAIYSGAGRCRDKINAIFSVEAFFAAWELFDCNIRQWLLFFFVRGGTGLRAGNWEWEVLGAAGSGFGGSR
jgi:hypothetical protein